MKSFSQARQDEFVRHILDFKVNGYFLEIGSNDPIKNNNTYILENEYGWKGIMVEYSNRWLNDYKTHRPQSIHVINNAMTIPYKQLFSDNNVPKNIDYLQIDLEVANGSTLKTLEKLDDEIFDTYKFATVTFEHDIYHTNFMDTRLRSREIFEKRGYVRVFDDVNDIYPFEDWYVHPDLVDMDYVNRLIQLNQKNYKNIVNMKPYQNQPSIPKSICYKDIAYIL